MMLSTNPLPEDAFVLSDKAFTKMIDGVKAGRNHCCILPATPLTLLSPDTDLKEIPGDSEVHQKRR